ncbi:MAG: cytochrome c [Lewinellaceae bacterium]|nr:cytochrome c [Saprospiraceae bacterium]MCB9340129.1 cytochrome c [Lewinellaceae bacterium]
MKKNNLFLTALFVLTAGLALLSCDKNQFTQGKILYTNFCERCHMEDGTGLRGIIPPLAGADFLETHKTELPCIIRYGIKGDIVVNGKTYQTEMPGEPKLTEFEITNIINYINTSWGNDLELARHTDVRAILKACEAARKEQ